MGSLTLGSLSHGKLPPEGERRPVAVPLPPAPLDDEAVAVVLRPFDPLDLDLKEFTECVPRGPDITDGVGPTPRRLRICADTSAPARRGTGMRDAVAASQRGWGRWREGCVLGVGGGREWRV